MYEKNIWTTKVSREGGGYPLLKHLFYVRLPLVIPRSILPCPLSLKGGGGGDYT